MTIEAVAKAIQDLRDASELTRPLLIAIEGFGGSGKSTMAEKLHQLLDTSYVVAMDDFIIKEKVLDNSWDKGAFDMRRLERQVLIPASSHEQIRYQRLIWQTNSLSDLITVPDVEYLIVEGITSYKPDIAHYYDFKIWVETPIEQAKARGRARDAGNENEQHWDLWAANDLRYLEHFHPEQRADFVVENGSVE